MAILLGSSDSFPISSWDFTLDSEVMEMSSSPKPQEPPLQAGGSLLEILLLSWPPLQSELGLKEALDFMVV